MGRFVRPAGAVCAFTIAALAFTAGCATSSVAEAAASRAGAEASADVEAPPKTLLQDVKRVVASPPLSLGVEGGERGTFLTGWKRYRGDWHIGRHWQERTRYRVEVAPDWDDPTGRSKLRVIAETEQRAAEGQRWDREPRVPRQQRAEEVLGQILWQLQNMN
jgi:hypothetical protein